jgi:hypothetical protein
MPTPQRVVLWSETRVRVKDLAGFRKTHTVPDRRTAATARFVADIAARDLKADLDAVYAAVRHHFSLKRRQVTAAVADGGVSVRSPDFEYVCEVALADDEPGRVVWQRQVVPLRGLDVLTRPEFHQTFGTLLNTLSFEYDEPLDVEGLVDAIEESEPPGVSVRCGADGSWCEVRMAGFPGTVRVERHRLDVRGRLGTGTKGLVEAYLALQQLLTYPAAAGESLVPVRPTTTRKRPTNRR